VNGHGDKEHQGERGVANIAFKQHRDINFPEHRDNWKDILADL